MSLNIIASQFFLPLSCVKLGRFITNIDHPHQGYHDPTCARAPEPAVSSRKSYVGLSHDSNNTSLGFAITSLMSAAFTRRSKHQVKVVADCVRTYVLDNSDEWFTEAMAKLDTRTWIERAIDTGDEIYMVVGFHTVTDARIGHAIARKNGSGGQINVPVGLTLATLGAIAPLGNILDPCVGGSQQSGHNLQSFFLAPGEQVCAFQYRKVRYRWFSSNSIDTSRLSRCPRWASVEKCRGEEDSEDDIIEVQMMPLQEKELDGDWDRMETPVGEILLIRAQEQIEK